MHETIYNHTNDSFKRIFAKSLKVHQCSYDPTLDLKEFPESNPGTVRCHLPLEAKALMFFQYCEEQGKVGRIITSDYKMETFTTPQSGLLCFVTVKADIYIDNLLAGSAVAGQCCDIGSTASMDTVIQFTSGLAKSRALSNAGFGIVSGTDVDASLVADPSNSNVSYTVGMNTVGNVIPTQGMDPAAAATSAMPTQNNGWVNPGQANGYNPNPASATEPSQVNLFQQLGGQMDALTQAKAMPYPLSGQYQGNALGSIPTRTLEFLANKATTDPRVEAAVQAARLILADRNKANGKVN